MLHNDINTVETPQGPHLPIEMSTSSTSIMVWHYGDVIMGAIASQITSLTIVYSTVYSDADQRKHQSSASLAFVRGIHCNVPFDDVIMSTGIATKVEVIAPTTYESRHRPRWSRSPWYSRALVRPRWQKSRYHFLFYLGNTEAITNKQMLSR